MHGFLYLMTFTAALFSGCGHMAEPECDNCCDTDCSRASNVTYVCVGMETSQRFGACPGCRKDSSGMDSLLKGRYGYTGVLLQSEEATKDAVSFALETGVAKTGENDLFIFYYSGHGGQENLSFLGTEEPDGADSMDEYLCLYDTYMLDDDLWKILSECKGRVFCIFDCCHSGTMFRSVRGQIAEALGYGEAMGLVNSSGFHFKPMGEAMSTTSTRSPIRMLCWSGCQEKEYSFGSSAGGVMTNTLLAKWRMGMDYDELWNGILKTVPMKQSTQHPAKTQYGGGFKEVFR